MSDHPLDQLARALDDPPRAGMSRRTALRVAAASVAGALLWPRGASPARAQTPSDPCQDCLKAVRNNRIQRTLECGRKVDQDIKNLNVFTLLNGFVCGWTTIYKSFDENATCRRICMEEAQPEPTPVPVANPGYPPSATGSGCPSGTHSCNGPGGQICCYGSDVCCVCIHPTSFTQCCIVEVGCACCPQS